MFDETEDNSHSALPVDIYALGIIMGQLWTKRAPWKGKAPHKVMSFILKGKRPPLDGFKDGPPTPPPPPSLKKLIEECWRGEAETRPVIDDVFTRFENEVIPELGALSGDGSVSFQPDQDMPPQLTGQSDAR
jgi:hypothetical protein